MSCRRPRTTLLAATLAGVLVAAALAGCDTDDGRQLADPVPGATAPVMQSATTATTAGINPPVGSADAGSLLLGSVAFAEGDPIPARFSCDGGNVSPPLAWTGVPAGTVELAITVVDVTLDVPFVHWAVAGLSPSLTGLDEGALPEGAVQARNDSSEFGWFGPCPPAGESHDYVFSLFALSAPSGVASGTGGPEAVDQIATTPGLVATLSGTYTGPPLLGD